MAPGSIYPVKMPWPAILADLRAAGCSNYRTALILGVSESTVQRWDDGSDPRHAMGQAIISLHEIICPNATQKRCMRPEVTA